MQNTRFMTKTKPTLTDQYSHQAAHLTARTSSGPSMTKGSKHYKQTHTQKKTKNSLPGMEGSYTNLITTMV